MRPGVPARIPQSTCMGWQGRMLLVPLRALDPAQNLPPALPGLFLVLEGPREEMTSMAALWARGPEQRARSHAMPAPVGAWLCLGAPHRPPLYGEVLEVCSPKPHWCPARRKQVHEHFSLVGILLPSSQNKAGKGCPAAGSRGQAERGLFRAVPSPHGCSVFYPLQEEDPDSESEKLVVREPEDEDGECPSFAPQQSLLASPGTARWSCPKSSSLPSRKISRSFSQSRV